MLDTILKIWTTNGVAEFLSALLGGGVTMGAQYLALQNDREKEAERRADEQRGLGWAIYFKISQAHEALTDTANALRQARQTADARGDELWQVFQFPPHDWDTVEWQTGELVLLIEHREFDLMQRYQEIVWWVSNLVQGARLYRSMRLEFFTSQPADVAGDQGTMTVEHEKMRMMMPTIAHLRSLANSLEETILAQQPDARKLLRDYAVAMQKIVGGRPEIQFKDEPTQVAPAA
jgi:hypothetical protein